AVSTVESISRFPLAAKPVTATEQYWAARALTAEALLAARITHTNELQALTEAEQEKRSREMEAVHRLHEVRHSQLERLVVVLLGCLVIFVSVVMYTFSGSHHHAPPARYSKPSHFTIPILSPFASVVEHETSVFNAKIITILALVTACLLYACFRYWLS
ncbi:hypothetical protein OBBRIDRAFT_714554, partial [Obba rivulosa]